MIFIFKSRNFFATAVVLYIVLMKFSIVFANPLEIYAEGAVLIDAKTGVVLYEKDMHEIYYPASITKIMTTLLAIENCEYDERVYMSANAVFGIGPGSSHIAMDVDESLSMEDALYGIMLASANEVSVAVAEHISGTNEAFAEMMTARAAELGALNTKFANPHGLHSDDHYTTPYDMAQIMKGAIEYDNFLSIISTRSYKIPPTEKQPLERPLINNHKMIQPSSQFYNEYVIGGKTGFTDEAGNTLVTYAVKDDIELISVVMKSGPNITYPDTETLLDYGFNMYHFAHLFDKTGFTETSAVTGFVDGTTTEVGEVVIVPDKSLTLRVPNFISAETVSTQVNLPEVIYEPIEEGAKIGDVAIMYDDCEIARIDLIIDKYTENELHVNGDESSHDTEEYADSSKSDDSTGAMSIWLLSILVLAGVVLIGAGAIIKKFIILR